MWKASWLAFPDVTSREESNALKNLTDLLASDLTEAEEDALIGGIRDAEIAYANAQKWTGQLVAELRRRGMSWPKIATATGLPQTNLVRRVRDLDDPKGRAGGR